MTTAATRILRGVHGVDGVLFAVGADGEAIRSAQLPGE